MKLVVPGYDVPFVGQSGVINPVWYEFLQNVASTLNNLSGRTTDLEARGVLDMPDVDNSTPITDGQVLVWNGTDSVFKPASN